MQIKKTGNKSLITRIRKVSGTVSSRQLQRRLSKVGTVVRKLAVIQRHNVNGGVFQHAGKMLEGIVQLFGQPVKQIEGLIRGINDYEKNMKSAPPKEVANAKQGLLKIYALIADVSKLAQELGPTVTNLPHFLVQR